MRENQSDHDKQHNRYDLHVHTHYSQCAAIKPEEIAKIAIKKKLNGIAITDHDTIKGALRTKKIARKNGINIVIGEEVSTDKGHLLAYDIQETIRKRELLEVLDEIRSQGGIAVIAHPFTSLRKKFLQEIPTIKNRIDGIETFNGRIIMPQANAKANALADKLKIGKTAGSDAHFLFEIGTGVTKFKGTLREAIKQRKTIIETGSQLATPAALALSLARKMFGNKHA